MAGYATTNNAVRPLYHAQGGVEPYWDRFSRAAPPSREEFAEFGIRNLLIRIAERPGLAHLLRRLPYQSIRRARQAAADADALDSERVQLGRRERVPGKAHHDIQRPVDFTAQRADSLDVVVRPLSRY